MPDYLKSGVLCIGIAGLLSGCTQLSAEHSFTEVSDVVMHRTGKVIHWNNGSQQDLSAQRAIDAALARPLTARSAIQIALLNNKELQAAYTRLGVAQADLVQAGLLSNPIMDGAITFPEGVSTPNLTFGLAVKFIEILWIPLKRAVAQSELEAVKLEVAGIVVDKVATTHRAFIDHVAARQKLELLRQVGRSTRATVETAKALRNAGNITQLQLDQQKNILTQANLDLAAAEVEAEEARERLNVLMGVARVDAGWRSAQRLPAIPVERPGGRIAVQRAIDNSIDLEGVRQRLFTTATRYRLTRKQSLLPDLEAGAEYERDDGERSFGPTFEIEIPIFDTGEAKRAKVKLEIKKLRNEYLALAVKIRSTARVLRRRLVAARQTIRIYEGTVLPENEKIVSGMQKNYNAMQAGVFQLITAKRQQIAAGQRYIEAQHDYWRAHISFQQLMHGRLPADSRINGGSRLMSSIDQAEEGGH